MKDQVTPDTHAFLVEFLASNPLDPNAGPNLEMVAAHQVLRSHTGPGLEEAIRACFADPAQGQYAARLLIERRGRK